MVQRDAVVFVADTSGGELAGVQIMCLGARAGSERVTSRSDQIPEFSTGAYQKTRLRSWLNVCDSEFTQ